MSSLYLDRYCKVTSVASALTFIGVCIAATTAAAATRTVCAETVIRDQRVDCPTTGAGVRRACSPGANITPVGFEIDLWDKDPDGTDEYISSWHIAGAGDWCVTFEWENASYSKGEADPDPYVKVTNRSRVGGDEIVRIVRADGTIYPPSSGRDGWGGNPDAGTALNCAAGATCWIAGGAPIFVESNFASAYAQALMALDTAQRVLAVYTNRLDALLIDIEYPTDEGCPTACAPSRTRILMPNGLADEGFRVAHELGHVLHMHEFNQDALRTDYSLSGGGWTPTSAENDSAAMVEGWATYVAAIAWWDPANTGSIPVGFGANIESAVLTSNDCSNVQPVGGGNRGRAIQVARAFWDLDDANNEGPSAPATASDTISMGTEWISSGWDNFADGTANRQDFETGAQGVNAHDYDFNRGANDDTFLRHNCIQSQQQ